MTPSLPEHERCDAASDVPARLQAVGQAKPGPIRPSRAGPKSRPEYGFGPA